MKLLEERGDSNSLTPSSELHTVKHPAELAGTEVKRLRIFVLSTVRFVDSQFFFQLHSQCKFR